MIRSLAAADRFGVLGCSPYDVSVGDDELLARLERFDLRGRGGAGFPAAVKLRSVRAHDGEKVVIANGEEGEPGSVKDRVLLRTRPELVLDGVVRSARIVGAARACVYASDDASLAAVADTLSEPAVAARCTLPVDLVAVPHTYVAGEASAVVRYVEGGPALPTAKPPRPDQRGYLVSNVDTLAQISLLATDPGPVTTRVTVSGGDRPPALYEVPRGTTLGELAAAHGRPDFTAALPSGMFGGIVDRTAADRDLGNAGCVRLLGADECPVALVAAAARFLGAESARQCGICVLGTSSLDGGLAALAAGTATADDLATLATRARRLPGRGACGLLDAAAAMAASLLANFPDLVQRHLAGPCPACLIRPDLTVPLDLPVLEEAS
jgi:NADH:ubiquinone oxidoreductase subunit F (NADH-binding)